MIRQIGPQTTRSDEIGVKVKYDHRNSVTAKNRKNKLARESRLKRTYRYAKEVNKQSATTKHTVSQGQGRALRLLRGEHRWIVHVEFLYQVDDLQMS